MYKIRVKPGEEVIQKVSNFIKEKNIKDAAIILVGAVDECRIHNMAKDDAKKNIMTEYKEPFEMLGTGEILDGEPNIHCTFSRERNEAVAGHLHWALVRTWYVDVFIIPLS